MACRAVFHGIMDRFGCQDFAGMAPQTVLIGRLDPLMGLVAFVTVKTGHGNLVRKRCPRRLTVTGQTHLPVGDKRFRLLGRKGMTPQTGDVLHADSMNFPALMASQAGVLLGSERMYFFAVTIFAR